MRRLAVLLALALFVTGTYPVLADELQDELAETAREIEAVKRQIGAAATERTALAEQVLATDAALGEVVAELRVAEADLAAVEKEVETAANRLDVTRAELADHYRALELTRIDLQETRAKARRRALQIYMGGGGRDVQSVIFSADEVTTMAVGLEYASKIAAATDVIVKRLESLEIQVGRQAEKIAEEEQQLADEVDRLEEQRGLLAALAEEVAAAKAAVERKLAEQRAQLDQVRHEVEHFEKELEGLEREQKRIEELIRREQERGTPAPSGIFVRPVPGRITSGFGYRIHPILGTRRLHTGIDMGGGYGTPIKAAAAGRVILAAYYGGYGNAIILDHGGGITTLYAHQSRLAVSKGSRVDAGQTIGYVGSTGLSTGPHLHFEVRKNGTPVNPAPYL